MLDSHSLQSVQQHDTAMKEHRNDASTATL